jgi:plasmid stability protein
MTVSRYDAGMAKVKTTVYVEEDVLRQIRVSAARRGRTVSELVEDALRKSTLSGLIESVRSKSDLSAEEALELAYSELHAMRRERDQPAA